MHRSGREKRTIFEALPRQRVKDSYWGNENMGRGSLWTDRWSLEHDVFQALSGGTRSKVKTFSLASRNGGRGAWWSWVRSNTRFFLNRYLASSPKKLLTGDEQIHARLGFAEFSYQGVISF
jgi:hypothetical protein